MNFYDRWGEKRGDPACGTCVGSGTTWQARAKHTEYGWRHTLIPCRDCALVPELAKIKAERANG